MSSLIALRLLDRYPFLVPGLGIPTGPPHGFPHLAPCLQNHPWPPTSLSCLPWRSLSPATISPTSSRGKEHQRQRSSSCQHGAKPQSFQLTTQRSVGAASDDGQAWASDIFFLLAKDRWERLTMSSCDHMSHRWGGAFRDHWSQENWG